MNTIFENDPVQPGRIFFILCLSAFFIVPGFAQQRQDLDVRAAIQTKIGAKPGTIVAAGIRVTNKSALRNSYTSQVVLPHGWKLVTRDFPFDLQPNESDMRLISFSIPAETPAGSYAIRYLARTDDLEAEATIGIEVASVIQLELSVLEAPRFAVAGSKFTTTFLLTNKGNSETAIGLKTRSSQGFPVKVDSTVQHFAPREAREIVLSVLTDAALGKISHTLELEAISGRDSTVRIRTSSVIDVVSRASKVEEGFLEYPVSIRLRAVGQDSVIAPQAEVYGYGSLSEQRTDRLEFLFRGPETQTKSVLGQRDEYHLSYRSRDFEMYGGDLNYSLSTLTEIGRYATGAGGRATVGSLSGGGFFNETRWSDQRQKEGGGFLNYDILRGATIGVNYLSKRELFNADIMTVRGLFTPMSGSNLELEYGTGTKDGKRDDAYAARFDGNRQWIAYDLRYVQSGSDFGGYYRDINFVSASVNLQVARDIRIESYARQEKRNLARDTALSYAPEDQFYQIGASYSDNLALYYRRSGQRDLHDSAKYRRQDDAMQGRLGYNFREASIYANADFGSTHDLILDRYSPYKRIALYASVRPASNQNYSASLEYSNEGGPFGDSTGNQERFSASLNAWLLLGQSTQVQLNFYTSRLNLQPRQTYSLVEASFEHIFPFNHKISFKARQNIITSTVIDKEIAYSLEYSIPVGVPVKRITAVGQLRGIVKDERGNGVANVLLNAGEDAAVTDAGGRYFFAALKPGSVFLSVDRASIGLDRITTQIMPLEVSVLGGEETNLDIGITGSATISGTILLYGSKDLALGDTSTSMVNLGGKSNIFLELTNGTEVNRRVSDNRGRFVFADMRPGTWTLRVIGGDIPEYHQVDPPTVQIVVKPGDKSDVAIRITPRKRTIKIIQEGNIIDQKPPTEKRKTVSVEVPKKIEPPKSLKQPITLCLVSYDVKSKTYRLQVSSWRTESKAIRVARIMERLSGTKSRTVNVTIASLGKRTRVFLVGFKSREEAEVMCSKLWSTD